MESKSKIYVAGHTGLVGSAIYRNLKSHGFTAIITRTHEELDLTRQDDTERFFNQEKPEYVFLAAAKVGGIVANMTYPAEFIYNNLTIAVNIIHAAYRSGVKKLLNLGSSCIFPKLAPQPLKESELMSGMLEPTNEAYALAKIAAIKLCRYYNQQYNTNYISAMPTNLYGINDNYNLETAHVLPALIRKFHLARLLHEGKHDLLAGDIRKYKLGFGLDQKIDLKSSASIEKILKEIGIEPGRVILWGTGEPFREFLHVDDLARACIFLIEKYNYSDIGEFINVGAGEDMKIKDIALIIKDVVGFKGEISHDTSKPDGMMRKLMDSSRIVNLGWKPEIDLEEGIRKTYKSYISDAE